jgi:hypothetical protein
MFYNIYDLSLISFHISIKIGLKLLQLAMVMCSHISMNYVIIIPFIIIIGIPSARNGNSEVSVYFLKAKQGYTIRKMKKKDKWV